MTLVWGNTHDHFLKSDEPGKAALESALWFSDKAHGGSEGSPFTISLSLDKSLNISVPQF